VELDLVSSLHHRALGRDLDQLVVSVVDNRGPMLAMMRAMLAAIGTGRIETHDSPAEALAAMGRTTPDLVIAAAAMQPVTGSELIAYMRKVDNEPLCFVPAMVTSAHAKQGVVEEALRAGAHQVLVLPTSASTLYRRLDWLLNDDRRFERHGDQYVVAGLEERLALSIPRPAYEPRPALARRPLALGEIETAPGSALYALKARAAQN
jgi:two-component system chemotaxis response regulator CheY